MNSKNWLIGIAVIIVVVFGAYYWMRMGTQQTSQQTPSQQEANTTATVIDSTDTDLNAVDVGANVDADFQNVNKDASSL